MTNKAIVFIKQYVFMLALVAAFIGFSAFKFAKTTDKTLIEDGWYEVSITSGHPNNPANQQIGDKLDSTPPVFGAGCATSNSGQRCAIHLTFDDLATGVPTTVADAESDAFVSVGQDSNYP